VKDFRELKVWQKAHELALAVYQVTVSFPREELYGLTTQMRRAGTSIAANLAEGCGRHGDAELSRFCSISLGSASELQYFLLLARDLQLLKSGDYDRLAEKTTEVKRHAHRFSAQAESCRLSAECTAIKISNIFGYI
jgi:four helix bundle protein